MAFPPYRPGRSSPKSAKSESWRILPAKSQSEEIQCELVSTSLGDQPEYNHEALSYTWGTLGPEPGKYIRLDAQHFQVFRESIRIFFSDFDNSRSLDWYLDRCYLYQPGRWPRERTADLVYEKILWASSANSSLARGSWPWWRVCHADGREAYLRFLEYY